MFARILFCTMLAGAIVGGVAWYTGHLPPVIEQPAASQEIRAKPEPRQTRNTADGNGPVGKTLDRQIAMAAPPPVLAPRAEEPNLTPSELIVISEARLALIRKQDVPAQQDGVLAFIGIEVKPTDVLDKDEKIWNVEIPEGNQIVIKRYRRLRVGDVIAEDQLLGLVDNTLAKAEYNIKLAKYNAAVADRVASEKTRDEAKKRWDTTEKLYYQSRNAVSLEDVRGAELTYLRYVYEEKSKAEAIKVAEQEKNQAVKQLSKYEIHAKIPGIVKAIYKRDGEAVSSTNNGKNSDPIVLIHNYDLLNVEGLVDAQDARALQQGMKVVVEPMRRERPRLVLRGHRLEITGVAVTKDPQNRLIVSASEDQTVRVWDLDTGRPKRILIHTSAVRAVACTPPGSAANLCLAGTADGKAWLWDLNSTSDQPLREFSEYHSTPISAVAFSQDGKTCATASEDGEVMLWDVSTGERRFSIKGEHRAVVTALHFIPDSQLVTVCNDHKVGTWKLGIDGARAVGKPIQRRSIDIPHLGVSADGKHVLDSVGQEMRVLSLPEGFTETIFQNPSSANVFKSLAEFSPDGRLVLTTSSPDGILQLWRLDKPRTSELRQFMPTEHHPATCAAFAPDGSYVIGGSKDRNVYVWPMPSRDEIDRQLTATLTAIGKQVENSSGQVKIIAELQNPPNHPLFADDVVTVVADPRK